MAQFDTWQAVITVFVCLNIIQFVIGSYLEPLVSGNVLAISPSVVLLAVFFWTWIWGLYGAFIGVPIALAALTFCGHYPSSRWIADLLAAAAARARRVGGHRFRDRHARARAGCSEPSGPRLAMDVEVRRLAGGPPSPARERR